MVESVHGALRETRTSGLSFPPCLHGADSPRRLRGASTSSNLTRGESVHTTVAHKIGHKTIHISDLRRDTAPEFEVVREGELMIYGVGAETPRSAAGSWHCERLELFPFLDRENADGQGT